MLNVLPDFYAPGTIEIASIKVNGVPRDSFSPSNFQVELDENELGSQVVVEFRPIRRGVIMNSRLLAGKKIAVLVESEFVPGEIEAYRYGFAALGAEVHFMSRLWNQPSQTFVSDVEQAGNTPGHPGGGHRLSERQPGGLRRGHHGGQLHQRPAAVF